jgi:hypothetical protein
MFRGALVESVGRNLNTNLKENKMSRASYLRRIEQMLPFDRFVYYINERYEIKLTRDEGIDPQEFWTKDPILKEYKFTNVKRAWDYTSRWLQENWYDPYGMQPVAGMAAAFARFFPYVPTLEAVGFPKESTAFKPETNVSRWLGQSRHLLAKIQDRGVKIFSSAYIIGGVGAKRKVFWVVDKFLMPVLDSGILMKEWNGTIDELHNKLTEFQGWGDFMTQEVILDLQQTFVLKNRPPREKQMYGYPGPGALRGLNRAYGRDLRQSIPRDGSVLEMIMLWEKLRGDKSGLNKELKRRLTVHDVEFNLCEFDKYSRALFGEGTPKQKFVPRDTGELVLL